MIVLRQCSGDNIEKESLKEYDYYYQLYLNNILVGAAAISINSDDMLYINIAEKYRGNNLGKETFSALIEKFKELGIVRVKVVADNSNIQMIRILNHYKYKIVSSGQTCKYYEIDIN